MASNGVSIGKVIALIEDAISGANTGIKSIVYDRQDGNFYILIVTYVDDTTSELSIPVNYQFENLYITKSGSTNISDDGNFRIKIDNDKLAFQRRDGSEWVTLSEIGSVLSTYFIIDGKEGKIDLLTQGDRYTMLKPSSLDNGVVLGNNDGVVSIVHNDTFNSYNRDGVSEYFEIQTNEDENLNGMDLNYLYTIVSPASFNSVRFKLANVPLNTNCRMSVLDLDDNVLDENISPNDFRLGKGDAVSNGLNELYALTKSGCPLDKDITVKLRFQFNNTVDMLGSTVDFGDGRGSRQFPYMVSNITPLKKSEVLTEYRYDTMDNIEVVNSDSVYSTEDEYLSINKKILHCNNSGNNINISLGLSDIDLSFFISVVGGKDVNLVPINGASISGDSLLKDNRLYMVYKRQSNNTWYSCLIKTFGGGASTITAEEVKTLYESNADTNAFTDLLKDKLNNIENNAQKNVQSDWNDTVLTNDTYIRNKPTNLSQFNNDSGYIKNVIESDVTQYESSLTISENQIDDLDKYSQTQVDVLLNNKVTKETGKGLSSNDFTSAYKSKLDTLESSKFKGLFPTLNALELAFPNPEDGSYAFVDGGALEQNKLYLHSYGEWEENKGSTATLTPEQVKSLYEQNIDTNAFTDTLKTKLENIQENAEVNVQVDWNVSDDTQDSFVRNKPTKLSQFTNDSSFITTVTESDVTQYESSLTITESQVSNLDKYTKTEIDNKLLDKVDKVIGKTLSTNDFTDTDKNKLNGIESGAEVNTVTSVSTRTGDIVLSKADVGLSEVDNTADLDKPISTATQNAIDTLSNESLRVVDLSNQVQLGAYTKSIIALCSLDNTDINLNSFSVGQIVFKRSNGIDGICTVNIQMEKKYNAEVPNVSFSMATPPEFFEIEPCTFTYNGNKYGGIHFYITRANFHYTTFNGVGNFTPFGLDYLKVNIVGGVQEIKNSEVYYSLNPTNVNMIDKFYINGNLYTKPNKEIISSGFNDDWSGTVFIRKTGDKMVNIRIDLIKGTDIDSGLSTIYTLPSKYMPSDRVNQTVALLSDNGSTLVGALAFVSVTGSGNINIAPIDSTKLSNARLISAVSFTYFTDN